MTAKKFQKSLRALFTKVYLSNKILYADWIAKAYRSIRTAKANNYKEAYERIEKILLE